ncbi:MAG: MoaD/ThiS family protein [Saprospiraceae bacterium]|nr:MoaD/ThiS family protein [Saprospiraceae bacterium]
MKIRLTSFGIAKDIVGQKEMEIDIETGSSIAQLKDILINRYPDFSALTSLSFAVDEEYREDGYTISENQQVIIIPPVSGG